MEANFNYQEIATNVLFYLKEKGHSVREPWVSMIYMEIALAFKLKKRANEELLDAFETTVNKIGKELPSDSPLLLLVQKILDHENMKAWHEQYHSNCYSQADWILSFLEYVSLVGPALGRCLLSIRNTPYLVLMSMLLRTPTAYKNAGNWPDDPPKGEFWNGSRWEVDRNLSWRPVSRYVIRAWLKWEPTLGFDEAEMGKVDIHVKINNLIGAVGKELDSWYGELDITVANSASNFTITAIELALKLDHSLVSQMDAWGQKQNSLSPVDRLDKVPAIRRFLTQADERARKLSQSLDEESRLTGEKMLTANICCLVYAGMLLSGDLPEAEKLKVLSRWPFSIPDLTRKRVSEAKVKEQLVDHLGRLSYQGGKSEAAVGNSRLKLWRGAN